MRVSISFSVCSLEKIADTTPLVGTGARRLWFNNHVLNIRPVCSRCLEVDHSGTRKSAATTIHRYYNVSQLFFWSFEWDIKKNDVLSLLKFFPCWLLGSGVLKNVVSRCTSLCLSLPLSFVCSVDKSAFTLYVVSSYYTSTKRVLPNEQCVRCVIGMCFSVIIS